MADNHADRRRFAKALGIDIPIQPPEQLIAGRSQAAQGRRGRAADVAGNGVIGKPQQFAQPVLADLFQFADNRRNHVERRILIPGIRHPSGGQGGGNDTAVDEAEVSSTGLGHGAWRAIGIEHIQGAGSGLRTFRQRLVETIQVPDRAFIRENRPFVNGIDVFINVLSGLIEKPLAIPFTAHLSVNV